MARTILCFCSKLCSIGVQWESRNVPTNLRQLTKWEPLEQNPSYPELKVKKYLTFLKMLGCNSAFVYFLHATIIDLVSNFREVPPLLIYLNYTYPKTTYLWHAHTNFKILPEGKNQCQTIASTIAHQLQSIQFNSITAMCHSTLLLFWSATASYWVFSCLIYIFAFILAYCLATSIYYDGYI